MSANISTASDKRKLGTNDRKNSWAKVLAPIINDPEKLDAAIGRLEVYFQNKEAIHKINDDRKSLRTAIRNVAAELSKTEGFEVVKELSKASELIEFSHKYQASLLENLLNDLGITIES